MAQVVLSNSTLEVAYRPAGISTVFYVNGSFIISDDVDEFGYTAVEMLFPDEMPTASWDPDVFLSSDADGFWDFNGEVIDFSTNVTISAGDAPIDPTIGIQYWG